ncbi:collagen binding domain-containing protein, partial [uncultured Oscillibacter sp.]|uniref:MSCRAMM family protein n=1 Tax=uncultured Oscillibacter sp. TaxID=876091 RepID=UPI0026186238
ANEPLAGVAFKVVDGSGKPLNPDGGIYYTNNAGEIVLEGLEPGTTITAQEVKTVDGYVLDGRPQSIKIEAGKAQNLTFWNKPAGSLVIRKLDKQTGKPLAGVEFEMIYSEGGYVDTDNGHLSSKGLYTTDDHGEIHISGIVGTVVVKETRPLPGYTIEPGRESQTVTVNPQETQTLTF